MTAFREGGSLPGLVEADDDGLYVVKFRGAGQGPRALVAEWLAGEIGRALGLLVPDLVAVDLDREIAESEPHEEVHDLLVGERRAQPRARLPARLDHVQPGRRPGRRRRLGGRRRLVRRASSTNPDRTPRNTNLLVWHGRTWLIDHGAALYIHHTWSDPDDHARRPFERIAEHVLLPFASSIGDASRAAGAAA